MPNDFLPIHIAAGKGLLDKDEIGKYFPTGATQAEMKKDILHGLELLKRERQRTKSQGAR